MLYKKSKAMTFAEVALVLVIIGVISALAIPGMQRFTQKSEFGKRAQKAYAVLNEALDSAVLEHGVMRYWGKIGVNNIFPTYISPYLSSMSGSSGGSSVITKDGMKYTLKSCMTSGGSGTSGSVNNLASCILEVDTNGSDIEPNRMGIDVFQFIMNFEQEKLIPCGEGTIALSQNNWEYSNVLWQEALLGNNTGKFSCK